MTKKELIELLEDYPEHSVVVFSVNEPIQMPLYESNITGVSAVVCDDGVKIILEGEEE